MGDPFLQVQSDVLETLEQTRPLFTSYLRIRSLATSPASQELVQARSELEGNIREISTDLQDLVASVRAVEQDPFRYGLDIDEVSRRSQLVVDVGNEVEKMRKELRGSTAKNTSFKDGSLPDPNTFDGDEDDEDGYEAFERQRQDVIMAEQDEALDDVFRTVGNLKEQADVMGRELEEQGEMLEEVDTLTDRVGDKLKGGMHKLNAVIRQNEDKYSSWCIGLLIFVLVILLILAIAL